MKEKEEGRHARFPDGSSLHNHLGAGLHNLFHS